VLELPEAEVLRKDLERELVGKRVKDVVVETPGMIRPWHHNRPEFVKALTDRKVTGVRRRGRTLFIDLDEGMTWLLDPGEQGSLHRETAGASLGADTHLAVSFTVGSALHLSEATKDPTARTGVVPTAESLEAAGITRDALDLLDDNPTWMEFGRYLAAVDQPLRLLLCDQKRVLGLGPVYSDEILWEAGLRHDRSSASLSTQEIRRLYRAAQEVIVAAMKASGSSLEDAEPESMIDEDGEAAEHLRVFGREGLPCPRCRTPIERTRLKRTIVTYHCPRCMI
jgi:formamidopyrimidine-DNA glycosylase